MSGHGINGSLSHAVMSMLPFLVIVSADRQHRIGTSRPERRADPHVSVDRDRDRRASGVSPSSDAMKPSCRTRVRYPADPRRSVGRRSRPPPDRQPRGWFAAPKSADRRRTAHVRTSPTSWSSRLGHQRSRWDVARLDHRRTAGDAADVPSALPQPILAPARAHRGRALPRWLMGRRKRGPGSGQRATRIAG